MKRVLCPRLLSAASLLALTPSLLTFAQSASASESRGGSMMSPALRLADDLGPVQANVPISVVLHLSSPQKDALHQAVAALYDTQSPKFHQWMTDAELAKYAPTSAQVAVVTKALEQHGLVVSRIEGDGFALRASGDAAAMQAAFHTELHNFHYGKKTFFANTMTAHLEGEADAYVSSISGLESHEVVPLVRRALDLRTGKPLPGVRLGAAASSLPALNTITTDVALSGPTTFTFTTPGASLPVGVYYGTQYDVNAKLAVDFTPAQLQGVYGLTAAYKQGLTGKGQTIVLLEGYAHSTIESDANVFNALTGLPKFTSANFEVLHPNGLIKNEDYLAARFNWVDEDALDVEWAHAMAPDAKIVVVSASGQQDPDFQAAMSYIVAHRVGYAVSNSWEENIDLLSGPAEQQSFEDILELAAAKGISFQFSTGDSGDNGLGTPLAAAGVPSDAPHGTAVGGTSLLNKVGGSGFEPVGWGTAANLIDSGGPLDPPTFVDFFGGAGGGESTYFAKPSWQRGLPGTGRQTPDVSALADPYTGVPIVVTYPEGTVLEVGYGGTSLASPLFTAIWALAQQKAGTPLGQAAPLVASLSQGVQDVLPLSSPTNVAGTIFDANGATFYSASALFSGALYTNQGFISAMWNLTELSGFPSYYDIGFGLDTSLTVTKGWDNVTGYGTPQGLAFIDAVAAAVKK